MNLPGLSSAGARSAVLSHTLVWVRRGLVVSSVVVLVFAIRRVLIDFPGLGLPHPPTSAEDTQYALHRWMAYLHIGPAVVYLVGAALQLSARFRTRHYPVHRRLGRVVLGCGLFCGLMALVFGTMHAFGGTPETVAVLIFGTWFEFCLVTAFVRIRAGDVVNHRRWMIRGFAIGTSVGTMRIIVGILAFPAGFRTAFWIAFWLAFIVHAAVAEWWLRRAPLLAG